MYFVLCDYLHSVNVHITLILSSDTPHWTHSKIWDGLSGISFFPCWKSLGYGFQRSLLDTHSDLLISVMCGLCLPHPSVCTSSALCLLVMFSSLLAFPPFAHLTAGASTEFSRICSKPQVCQPLIPCLPPLCPPVSHFSTHISLNLDFAFSEERTKIWR